MKNAKEAGAERELLLVTDVRHELQDFIRFLRETAEGSLSTKLALPERRALQRALEQLQPSTTSLIGTIERSVATDEAREVAMNNLCGALASAYMIGSEGTIGKNTEVAIGNKRAEKMRERKAQLQPNKPENRIIQEIVDRHRSAGDGRDYKAADVVVNEAQPALKAHGFELTDKQVRGRAVRLLKKPARS